MPYHTVTKKSNLHSWVPVIIPIPSARTPTTTPNLGLRKRMRLARALWAPVLFRALRAPILFQTMKVLLRSAIAKEPHLSWQSLGSALDCWRRLVVVVLHNKISSLAMTLKVNSNAWKKKGISKISSTSSPTSCCALITMIKKSESETISLTTAIKIRYFSWMDPIASR